VNREVCKGKGCVILLIRIEDSSHKLPCLLLVWLISIMSVVVAKTYAYLRVLLCRRRSGWIAALQLYDSGSVTTHMMW
jgi:hypothetical protein